MRLLVSIIAAIACACPASAQQDPGKTQLGLVRVDVYFATDGDPTAAGADTSPVLAATTERLRKEQRLRFKHYLLLGSDTQPLYRSYENWAEPLKPSDEVMVRFEAQSEPTAQKAVLDLELWLGRKKTIKADARLEGDKPLYVLGPEWRHGRLIISISLAHKSDSVIPHTND